MRQSFKYKLYPTKVRLWKGHLWGPSYFIVTAGGAPLDVVKKYVETHQVCRQLRERGVGLRGDPAL